MERMKNNGHTYCAGCKIAFFLFTLLLVRCFLTIRPGIVTEIFIVGSNKLKDCISIIRHICPVLIFVLDAIFIPIICIIIFDTLHISITFEDMILKIIKTGNIALLISVYPYPHTRCPYFLPCRQGTETSDAHVNALAFEALPDIIKEMYVETD